MGEIPNVGYGGWRQQTTMASVYLCNSPARSAHVPQKLKYIKKRKKRKKKKNHYNNPENLMMPLFSEDGFCVLADSPIGMAKEKCRA